MKNKLQTFWKRTFGRLYRTMTSPRYVSIRRQRRNTSHTLERLETRFAMAAFTAAKFDFGTATSPLESGYTRVTQASTYTPTVGFGWSSGAVLSFDRAVGTPLIRDFNYTFDGTFSVDVPNGLFRITVMLGDTVYPHDQMGVYIEGVLRDSVSTAAGQVLTRSYDVNVVDQQLTLRLRDLGGIDRNTVIQSLEFSLASQPPKLTLSFPATPLFESRVAPLIGTVSRNGATDTDLLITFVSSDTTEASVVASTIIPRGQTTAAFEVQVVDDAIVDGTQNVVIFANAVGYQWDGFTLSVGDNEQPPFFRVFDFSTTSSALVGNFAKVSHSSTYTEAVGYGFTAGTIRSADRGGATLLSDFVYTTDGTFVVNAPNGNYTVDLILGDVGNFAHDNMGIFIEGIQVGTVSTGRGQIVAPSYRTQVADGQLTFRFRDLGGSDANVVVEGLRIYATSTQPDPNVFWPTQPTIPDAIFSQRQVNSDGFHSYSVNSIYQRSANTIRVLLPSDYDPTKAYRVVYVLPVEAGNGRQFGDGLITARSHGLQNSYNAIFVAPTFTDIPWYADHATDRSIWQETYFRDVVVRFIETQYKTIAGSDGRYLLGFSKSGYGAVAMLLRNPDYFGRAMAWDSPLAMSNPSSGVGFSGVVGTTQNFANNYQISNLLNSRGSVLKGQPPRIFLLGYSTTYGTFYDHQVIDAQMTSLGIPHVYVPGVRRSHVWNSGWMPDAVRMLFS